MHGFGREGFSVWVDPERGPVIEPYGPALRGRSDRTTSRDHCGRAERRLGGQPPVDSCTTALPNITSRTSVCDSDSTVTIRPICPPRTAFRLNCHRVSAASATLETGSHLGVDGLVTEVVAAFVELAELARESWSDRGRLSLPP